jgi:hypothetical protein
MPLVVPSETRDSETNLEAKNIPLLATHLIVILSSQSVNFDYPQNIFVLTVEYLVCSGKYPCIQ